ncbi:TPA: histidinol dehydrogenase [Candidatus Woesearchaeota archaeon]|nr:histidinol dehydrogenase [Candidatus Woesearchaeota archaeon]HII69098.1 histidinol dehydrogenase [Candidatus Woesearchaeota archaeon]
MPILRTLRGSAAVKELQAAADDALLKAELKVRPVQKAVKAFGDKALIEYTQRFDSVGLSKHTLEVSKKERIQALKRLPKKIVAALATAGRNIETYAKLQLPSEWKREVQPGIFLGQIIRPLLRVGCYVPCGAAPLPSTALMTVIPAKVAGVAEVIVCVPPKEHSWEVIAAAEFAGADRIFRVGGAQAIFAMAYGTETVPKVDKIAGPGNIFVTAAKRLAFGDCGIDMLAGPSEVLVYSNSGNPVFIAADLLAQAEHDASARPLFVTTNEALAKEVNAEAEKQLSELPHSTTASASLRKNGAIVMVKNEEEACAVINALAPEHLELYEMTGSLLAKVRNAGAIFGGPYSAEVLGDYVAGPSHVIPTGGTARFRGALGAHDFVKIITYQEISRDGFNSLADAAATLAETEGLLAHKHAVEVRKKQC